VIIVVWPEAISYKLGFSIASSNRSSLRKESYLKKNILLLSLIISYSQIVYAKTSSEVSVLEKPSVENQKIGIKLTAGKVERQFSLEVEQINGDPVKIDGPLKGNYLGIGYESLPVHSAG
jgi:hypothetical protein